ncbi:MAG: caspase family protein [Flavobacteriales bacterium]|nr:caspase family protein [Flavobacteriales bacterium]
MNDGNEVFHFDTRTKTWHELYIPNQIVTGIHAIPGTNFILLHGFDHQLLIYDFVSEKSIKTYKGISSYCLSKTMLVLGTENGTIVFLDFNLNQINSIKIEESKVCALAMHENTNQLAIAYNNGKLIRYDLKSNSIASEKLDLFSPYLSMAFNEDGSKVATHNGYYFYWMDSKFNVLHKIETSTFYPNFIHIKPLFGNFFSLEGLDGFNTYYATAKSWEYSQLLLNTNNQTSYSEFTIQPQQKKDSIYSVYTYHTYKAMREYYLKHPNSYFENASGDSIVFRYDESKKVKLLPQENQISFHLKLNKTEVPKKNAKSKPEPIEILPQIGYPGPIIDLLYCPSENIYITYSESPIIKIWTADLKTLIKEIKLPEFNIIKAAIHPQLPLLTVWDQNYEIHIIDLKSFLITHTLHYSDFKYNYNGDFDDNFISHCISFELEGNWFSIHDTSYGNKENSRFYYDENTLTHAQLTSDLVAGKNKPLKIDNNEYSDFKLSLANPIYPGLSFVDTLYSESIYLEDVKMKENDSCYYYVSTYLNDGVFRYFLKRTLFEDEKLKQELKSLDTTLSYFSFYQKLEHPKIQNHILQILDSDHSKRFLLVFETVNNNRIYSIFDRKENKIIKHNVSASAFFMGKTQTYFINNNEIYGLTNDFHYNLNTLKSRLYDGKSVNLARQYYSISSTADSLNPTINIWHPSMDHTVLSLHEVTNQTTLINLPKPELGRVRPSLLPSISYINAMDHFTRLDPINLSVKNYWITTQNLNGNLKFIVTDAKPENKMYLYFPFFQYAGEYTNAGSDWALYTFNELLEIRIFKEIRTSGNKTQYPYENKTHFFDINTKSWVDKPEFLSLQDTIAKLFNIGDHHLGDNQIENFENYQYNYDGTAGIRAHGKYGEHSFLEYYYLANEYSDVNLYMCKDIIDSAFYITTDLKYTPIIADPFKNKPIKKFETPPVPFHFMHLLYPEKKFMTYGYDGGVRVYDMNGTNKKPIYTFYKSGEEHIFITPDNYYKSNAKNNQFIKFRHNNKIYGIEQFDLKYNRPDILLQRIGNQDSVLISSYHAAYIKRLKRMGFTEDMLSDDFHLPEIKIFNFESLPAQTDTPELELELNVLDEKFKLDRINVFINDVPVFGTKGIDLRNETTQQITKKIKLNLCSGKNKIQVSVLNQAGAESYKETIEIQFNNKINPKPELYLITIGDSKYLDERYNLSYAAKDAKDIAAMFQSNSSLFSKTHIISLTDEKVTKENVAQLKETLLKAKRDDVVILSVAGHGVLDEKLNYYLATYEMDFNKPAEKGIPYEELESILDGIEPLKKVIFIDACHSGEIDKEEVSQIAQSISGNEDIKFRNAGAGIQKKTLGLKTTSELMAELFTDLRRGTGATVISSSGGVEYAMESAEWKNGLFTYCLLHGLKNLKADLNQDGMVMLSELQQYLRSEVILLSNGAQQPTSRIENLSLDFRIW